MPCPALKAQAQAATCPGPATTKMQAGSRLKVRSRRRIRNSTRAITWRLRATSAPWVFRFSQVASSPKADKKDAPWALIINHAMAERYWPHEDVIGKRITFEDAPKKDSDWMTVVGVVGDVKDQPNSPGAEPAFWWSEFQAPQSDMSIAIRTQSDPRQVADGLRDAVHRLDPALAVADVKLMDSVVDTSVSTPRFTFVLVGLFAGLAILAGSYRCIRRDRIHRKPADLGVWPACRLGAQRSDLLRMVLAQSAKLAVPGTILGVLLALSLGRVVQNLIYGVSPADPVILSTVVLLVLTVALIASYVPARRASRSDPMTTLRAE